MPLITDPWFYAVAIPAVLLFGIAKGGFGGEPFDAESSADLVLVVH